MAKVEYGSLKFAEAIDFFKTKVDVPTARWADIWRDQHNLAFMVAGAAKADLLADMRKIVDQSIANGKSLNWFQTEFKGLVKKHGWDHTGSAAWRANIIYSTNMRQSYNAGRYAQLQHFEYWRYKHGDSRNPRLHHKSKDGTILPKTSPFWNVWFPQNGWGCRCKVFGESDKSLARKGLKPSKEPTIENREWIDKATGESHQVPVGIDPGFDYAPGKASQASIHQSREQTTKLTQLATKQNWQTHGRPEKLPQPIYQGELAPIVSTKEALQSTIEKYIGSKESVIKGPVPALNVYVDAKYLAEHIDIKRAPFVPILLRTISDPYEVWETWHEIPSTDKLVNRLRYIYPVKAGKYKGQLLVAEVQKGILIAYTFVPVKSLNYLNKQRVGNLIYVNEGSSNE